MAMSDSVRLAYDVYQPSHKDKDNVKPPVILLHGLTSTKETWGRIPQDIANNTGREVYALDARNHGGSDWSDDHSYHIMAEDIGHFMNKMNIPTAVIVGHSMGGKTAMALATSQPEKVEKLIVEDISPRYLGPSERRFPFAYLKLLRQSLSILPLDADIDSAKRLVAEFLYTNIPSIHKSPTNIFQNSSVLPLRKEHNRFSWNLNLDVLEKSFFTTDNPKNKIDGNCSKPALFVYGTKSAYTVSQDKDLILQLFPQASLYAIEGATHLVHMEKPGEFLSNVIKFINS